MRQTILFASVHFVIWLLKNKCWIQKLRFFQLLPCSPFVVCWNPTLLWQSLASLVSRFSSVFVMKRAILVRVYSVCCRSWSEIIPVSIIRLSKLAQFCESNGVMKPVAIVASFGKQQVNSGSCMASDVILPESSLVGGDDIASLGRCWTG